jgi:hypothetical protein
VDASSPIWPLAAIIYLAGAGLFVLLWEQADLAKVAPIPLRPLTAGLALLWAPALAVACVWGLLLVARDARRAAARSACDGEGGHVFPIGGRGTCACGARGRPRRRGARWEGVP